MIRYAADFDRTSFFSDQPAVYIGEGYNNLETLHQLICNGDVTF